MPSLSSQRASACKAVKFKLSRLANWAACCRARGHKKLEHRWSGGLCGTAWILTHLSEESSAVERKSFEANSYASAAPKSRKGETHVPRR